LHHTHEGSIGNLCNQQIQQQMQSTLKGFEFNKAATAIEQLLASAKNE
jgi:argininosuccinate lyase